MKTNSTFVSDFSCTPWDYIISFKKQKKEMNSAGSEYSHVSIDR